MSITFNCPHCQRPLKVKDELAGKKARCPGCQQTLRIPAPVAAADIEAAAAAALADEPKPPEPVREQATVTFRCMYCDEEVHVGADLAGKQAPCPSCRRIVKVPVPVKQGPKDWRQADNRLPSGARRDGEPELAGAWGSATSAARVSSEALIEADAEPVVRERVTVRQWIVRGLVAAAAVGLIGTGIWGVLLVRRQTLQARALNEALAYAGDQQQPPLPAGVASELHRALGEYYLRAPDLDKARQHFPKAVLLARRLKEGSPERDALLIDLATTLVDEGGDDYELVNHTRVSWTTVRGELAKALGSLSSPEARAEAVREVGGKLIARDQQGIAQSLVNELTPGADERPELLSVFGLALHRAGGDAKPLAKEALQPYQTKPPAGKEAGKAKRAPVSPALIALLLALNEPGNVREYLVPAPKPGEPVPREVRVGYAHGWALQGKLDQARHLANDPVAQALERLEALVAVGSVEQDDHKDDARKALEAALGLVGTGRGQVRPQDVSPWLLLRLVRLGAGAGVKDEQLDALVRGIPERGWRDRAQREVLRARLGQQPDLQRLAEPDKYAPLTLGLLARHNARLGQGSAVMDLIQGWQPEALRPLGYAGVILGMQDNSKE